MNKLRKVTLSFILSLLLITGVMPAGTTYSPVVSVEAAVSKKQTAKFVKAVDGDTAKLSVKGRTYTFRFLAVDTPETVKPNTPVAFMGKRASDYTKSELKKAKKSKYSMMVIKLINTDENLHGSGWTESCCRIN